MGPRAPVRGLESAPPTAEARGARVRGGAHARTQAEQLESASKERADRLDHDARNRAQMLDTETAERRQQLFGDLETEKARLDGEVENLRSFEREYRSRLRDYFHQQLAALDGETSEAGEPPADDGQGPRRLKALLGEDEGQRQG